MADRKRKSYVGIKMASQKELTNLTLKCNEANKVKLFEVFNLL